MTGGDEALVLELHRVQKRVSEGRPPGDVLRLEGYICHIDPLSFQLEMTQLPPLLLLEKLSWKLGRVLPQNLHKVLLSSKLWARLIITEDNQILLTHAHAHIPYYCLLLHNQDRPKRYPSLFIYNVKTVLLQSIFCVCFLQQHPDLLHVEPGERN